MKKAGFLIVLIFFVLTISTYTEARELEYETQVLIIYENNASEHKHYENIFNSISIDYHELKLKDFDINKIKKYNMVVFTKEIIEDMTDKMITDISLLVYENGLNVIVEGRNKLSELFGIEYLNEKLEVEKIRDLKHEEIELTLETPLIIEKFKKNSEFYGMYEYITKYQFLSAFSYGEGKVIYLSTHVGYEDSEGYKIYPYLHEYITEYFEIDIPIERNSLIAYIDWGYYYDKNPFELAKNIKSQGINEVHISAWYDVSDYYVFMDKFVDACHTYGILVYAWLEYPMITNSFYEENPEFREVTVMGTNAEMTWRKLVALDIPECNKKVKEHAIDFINRYEFDGVDFAELYYELPVGDEIVTFEFDIPGLSQYEKNFLSFFTPMNEHFRKTYEEKMGYDPILVFDPESEYFFKKHNLKYFDEFIDYRRQLLKDLNEDFITFFQNEEYFGEGLDVIVTQIDSIFDESILNETGVWAQDFIDLQNKHEFTFMIEDPFPLWSKGPSRYTLIGEEYGDKMTSIDKFFIDINVVHRIDTIYPHDKQTGLEFAMLISEASKSSSKVCIYSEQTPYRFDYKYIHNAMASMVEIEKCDNCLYFNSPKEFEYLTDVGDRAVYIDGKLWPGVTEDGIFINSGEHKLELKEEKKRDFYVRDINVDFEVLEYFNEGIHLKRKLGQNMFITLNERPAKVVADGRVVEIETFYTSGQYILYFNFDAKDIYIYENGVDYKKVSVFINGKEQIFESDIVVIANRCFLPATEMLNIIGAKYEIHTEFNDPTIFGEYNGYVFWMQSNNKEAKENGNDFQMDVYPHYLYDKNKFMLPLRYVFESLGFEVDWKYEEYMVLIN